MPMPKGFKERPGFAPELKLEIGDDLIGRIIGYKVVTLTEKNGKTREQPLIQILTDGNAKVKSGRYSLWLGSDLEDRIHPTDVDKVVWIERIEDKPIEGRPSPMKAYNAAVEE